jgi:hypothetical protein
LGGANGYSPVNVNRWHALGPALLLAVVSWTVALAHVARNYWFDAGDLRPFAFWCVVAGVLAYPALRTLKRRTARAGSLLLLCIASLAGLVFAVAWTFLVALVLGGWMGAFGFPVLLCWIVGSVFGFLASAVVVWPRIWPAAGGLAAALPIATAAVLSWLSHAPADAIVYLKPGTTHEQATHVWNEVLATPTERGFKHLEGVQSMAAADDDARQGIRLSFQPGTSEERKAAILALARAVPFVDEIVDTPRPTQEDVRRVLREFREKEQAQ